MVEASRTYDVIPGAVENDDDTISFAYRDDLLAAMFTVPEAEPVPPPGIVKMEGALHALYQQLNIPDLRIEAGKLIGSWMMNGEQKTILLYEGEDIGLAHDVAAKVNAAELEHWAEQQHAEQAAEARNERYFVEGNGAHAFYYEDMARWGRWALFKAASLMRLATS